MSKLSTADSNMQYLPVTSIITIYLLSLFSLILGYGSSRDYYHLQEFGVKTTATVLDTYDVPRVGNVYTIRYYTQDNQEIVVNTNNLMGNRGDTVEILYDPNGYGRVILASATPRSWIGYLMSGMFFLIATAASFVYIKDKRTTQ